MAQAGSTQAINRLEKKATVRNLQYGPKKQGLQHAI